MEQQFYKYLFGKLSKKEKTSFLKNLDIDQEFSKKLDLYKFHLIEEYVLQRASKETTKDIEQLMVSNQKFREEIKFQQTLHNQLNNIAKLDALNETIETIRLKLDSSNAATSNSDSSKPKNSNSSNRKELGQ